MVLYLKHFVFIWKVLQKSNSASASTLTLLHFLCCPPEGAAVQPKSFLVSKDSREAVPSAVMVSRALGTGWAHREGYGSRGGRSDGEFELHQIFLCFKAKETSQCVWFNLKGQTNCEMTHRWMTHPRCCVCVMFLLTLSLFTTLSLSYDCPAASTSAAFLLGSSLQNKSLLLRFPAAQDVKAASWNVCSETPVCKMSVWKRVHLKRLLSCWNWGRTSLFRG